MIIGQKVAKGTRSHGWFYNQCVKRFLLVNIVFLILCKTANIHKHYTQFGYNVPLTMSAPNNTAFQNIASGM